MTAMLQRREIRRLQGEIARLQFESERQKPVNYSLYVALRQELLNAQARLWNLTRGKA